MTYRGRSAAHTKRTRDKFEMRAQPLVQEATHTGYRDGHTHGHDDAVASMRRVLNALEGETVQLGHKREDHAQAIELHYPPSRLDRMRSPLTPHLPYSRQRTEMFRWIPWTVTLNDARIIWYNLMPDSEDGRRRSAPEARRILSDLDKILIILDRRCYVPDPEREMRQLLLDCSSAVVRWLADPWMAEKIGQRIEAEERYR